MSLQVFPAVTDDDRILCHIVDVADSNEPGYKLRCLSGLLKGLHQTFALVAVSTATQQSQGNPTSISKVGSEIVLSPAARAEHRHLCISNKVGVSCNCRKGM